MPNWCDTSITFCSKNERQIRDFHHRVESLCNQKKNWLGDICIDAGYTREEIDKKIEYCRGFVEDVGSVEEGDKGFFFSVWSQDAWAPIIKPWRMALDKLYKRNKISICWIAEEPGCEIYSKYDPLGFYEEYQYYYSACPYNTEYTNRYKEFVYEDYALSLCELQQLFGLKHIEDIMRRAEEIDEDLENHDAGYLHIYEYTELDFEY